MPVEPPGDPGEERADDKGDDLVTGCVQADRLGGDLVIVRREEAPPVGGMHQADDDEDRERGEGEDPGNGRIGRNAVEPERPAEGIHVLEDHPDDLTEAEGHDGEVVALEPQRRHPDQQAGHGRAEAAAEERAEKQQALLHRGATPGPEDAGAEKERDGR